MSDAGKRESSVLFSLRELQRIEQDRVQEEVDRKRQEQEEKRLAAEEAERQRAAEEAARVEQERLAREQQKRAEKEAAHRLKEAEARARVAAEAELERQRLDQELELRRQEVSRKRPTGLIAIVTILVLVVSGLGYWAYQSRQETIASAERAAAAQVERKRLEKELREQKQLLAQLNDELIEAQEAIKNAKSDAEREAAQRRVERLQNRIKAVPRSRGSRGSRRDRPKPENSGRVKITKECMNNPLHHSCR